MATAPATTIRLPARAGIGRTWWDRHVTHVVVALVAVLALASFAWIYGENMTWDGGPPVRTDGAGYYVYLPAVLLNHELGMERTAERSYGGDPSRIPGVRPAASTGRLLDAYPIGVAVMTAPFFAAGHVAALASGTPRDGYSWPYQAAAAAAGLSYMLAGLLLLGGMLRRWFGANVVGIALVGIVFGTNLFNYGTYDATFSHAFSFALVALVLRLTLALGERATPAAAAGLGATLGLLTLVRPTNLVALLLPALYGIQTLRDVRPRMRMLRQRARLIGLGCGCFALVLLPQLLYWQAITGRPFANGYPGDEHLDFLHPHVVEVLFSVRKGLFFWSPLLLLAVLGVPLLRRFAPRLVVPVVAYLLVHGLVVASWSVWWYGGSLGMRPFVEALPVLALGLAALVASARTFVQRRLLAVSLVVTTAFALHAMLGYWRQTISYDQMTLAHLLNSFLEY
jgi:hypothetical protein